MLKRLSGLPLSRSSTAGPAWAIASVAPRPPSRSSACGGHATRRWNHGVVGILRRRLRIQHHIRRFAKEHERTFDFVARGSDGIGGSRIENDDLRGDFAFRSFAPAQRANLDAALNGTGNLGGIRAPVEGMRHLRGFQVRVNAVILEALQRPVAGLLHLRAASQPRTDLRGEVFQILHELGVGLLLRLNLLVSALHRGAIFALGGAFGVALLRLNVSAQPHDKNQDCGGQCSAQDLRRPAKRTVRKGHSFLHSRYFKRRRLYRVAEASLQEMSH